MHDYDHGPTHGSPYGSAYGSAGGAYGGSIGGSGDPSAYTGYGDLNQPPRRSPFGLACTIACVAVAAVVGLGVVFWALGFVFDMLGWILRIAILAAVAAFVWRRVTRRWSNTGT